ncbi:MAG: acyl-CoA dehydrogenase family protein [Chloroflexi bacterium]|nr:acyl-CoA dehydrogenase family protein [Chloroflexota bacterium]
MDDYGYGEAEQLTYQTVLAFARDRVAPGAAERDRTSAFDYALYGELGALGVPGMLYPESVGGTNASTLAFCLALEAISRVDMSLGWVLWVGAGGARSMLRGSDEQVAAWRERFVLPMVAGETVSAGGITEPDAGSDTAGIRTKAVRDGGEWVLNGSKIFISNAGLEHCAFVTALARTEDGFGLFVLPTGTPGYTMGPPLRKMGLHSADTRELSFADCRIPAYHLLESGGGGRQQVVGSGFALTRVYLASQAVGLAGECFDLSLEHARGRVAFKRKIGQFQHVQAMLVDMYLGLETGRLLRDRAARMSDARIPYIKEAALAKLHCTEMAKRAADMAVQVFGGLGYMDDTPVSRYYRDIRAATIAEGTSEIQKHIIAREIGALG